MMMGYHLFVGIDIAARSFTASWTRERRSFTPAQTLTQNPEGFARLERQLTATGVAPVETLLVLEATSSYWVALAVHLHEAGYRVAVVNPMHLRNDARSLPRRAKTDALDAQLLAQFAAERQPDAWTPPPQVYHELRQRLVTHDTLVTMRQQTRNQHHALSQWPVTITSALQQLEEVIADLDERIATLDRELAALLRDSAWAASATLLQTIPGIGVQSTAWLLVATLSFTLCASAEALAAYAGLVPLDYQSGSSVQQPARIGPGGNARLRRVIYLAAVVACRFNPPLKAYYERLRAAGKPVKVVSSQYLGVNVKFAECRRLSDAINVIVFRPSPLIIEKILKVARCAVARKLLHQAWAVVTKQQPFDPDYPQPARAQAA